MKKGMVYIEALVSSVITIVLIVSVSKLSLTGVKILENTREKGKALDIVRGVSSLYRADKLIALDSGINIGKISDLYCFIENGERTKGEKDFILYTENVYKEGIQMIKIKIVSSENKFKDISMVVAK
ncbi:hypothetical protein [Clostridium cylindrosporum]|uniref:Uncharacterized protein n=1 Tax=Clostridium cylindrosporum DSM 605 TaxID=1121307 RepID=A0A0J8G0K8_CLOCY|nr:hypothetical protein [Clostridium cylindrosporum]KMT21331.1 hypothetical protein CLCY_2c00910 [Clostridium cylindrosporum DSM 605]